MIQAGQLRHVVSIQKPSQVQDTSGQIDTAYTELYSCVRAQIVPLSGREYVTARQVVADVTTRIVIRKVPNIEPACRIVSETEGCDAEVRVYDILAVLPDPVSGERYLTLMCVQVFADGWRRGEL